MTEIVFVAYMIWLGGIQEGPDGFPVPPPVRSVYELSVLTTGGDPGIELAGSCLHGAASKDDAQGKCCQACMSHLASGTPTGILMEATCTYTTVANPDGSTSQVIDHADCQWMRHPALGMYR